MVAARSRSTSAPICLPASTAKLVIENRHASRIAVYQANALVPRDPELRIVAQKRNYTQSVYEVDFSQGAWRSASMDWWPAARGRLGTGMLIIAGWAALLWRQRGSRG